MYLSTSSSDRDGAAAVTGQSQTLRAGLRIRPPTDQPSGVFVVVEMAILVIVAALAMVSIIVSSGADDEVRAAGANAQSRLQASREEGARVLVGPSPQADGRPNASVTPR